MAMFQSVCFWCKARGTFGENPGTNKEPSFPPVINGYCKCHPSGKPNMPHTPRWEKV